jgi:hypothetical protein
VPVRDGLFSGITGVDWFQLAQWDAELPVYPLDSHELLAERQLGGRFADDTNRLSLFQR